MNPLLFVIIVISILAIVRGWRRGLFGIVYGIFSWAFMLAFVSMANPLLYQYMLNNEEIYDKVYDFVYPYADQAVPQLSSRVEVPVRMADLGAVQEYLKNYTSGDNNDESVHIDKDVIEQSGLDIPESVKQWIPENGIDIPSEVVEKAVNGEAIEIPDQYEGVVEELEKRGVPVSDYIEEVNEKLSETAGDIRKAAVAAAAAEATKKILKGLALLLTYLIAKAICLIVRLTAHTLMQNEAIHFLSRATGALAGMAEACLYIWILLAVISMFEMTPVGQKLYAQVQENDFLQMMYENDPFKKI